MIAPLAYLAMLRATVPRRMVKMSACEWVFTIAIGVLLASIIVTDSVSLLDGVVAMLPPVLLQSDVTWVSMRSWKMHQIVTGERVPLFHNGQMLRSQRQRARVKDVEVRTEVRSCGFDTLAQVGSVVLETDEPFSVLPDVETTLPPSRPVQRRS